MRREQTEIGFGCVPIGYIFFVFFTILLLFVGSPALVIIGVLGGITLFAHLLTTEVDKVTPPHPDTSKKDETDTNIADYASSQ
jgi:hypothetical protein